MSLLLDALKRSESQRARTPKNSDDPPRRVPISKRALNSRIRVVIVVGLLGFGLGAYLWMARSTLSQVDRTARSTAAISATSARIGAAKALEQERRELRQQLLSISAERDASGVATEQAIASAKRREWQLTNRIATLEQELLAMQGAHDMALRASNSVKDFAKDTRSDPQSDLHRTTQTFAKRARTTQQPFTLRLSRELETLPLH